MQRNYQVLPPLEGFDSKELEPLRKLIAELEEKTKEWRHQNVRHQETRAALSEAQEKDQQERASALRGGKKDPGRKHEEKLRAKLAEIEDRQAVLGVVVGDVERDLSRAIAEAKPALIREARTKREEASKTYTEAHRRLREAHDTFKLYDGLVRWAFAPSSHFAPAAPDMHVLSMPAVLEDNDPEKPAPEVISTESAGGLLRGA